MKLFRYKRDQFIDMTDLFNFVQNYGKEGWELVTVVPVQEQKVLVLFVLLKQEYEN